MYEIIYMFDESDCELCGREYAEGYRIEKDGVVILDKSPMAHCFAGASYDTSQAPLELLKLVLPELEFKVSEEHFGGSELDD